MPLKDKRCRFCLVKNSKKYVDLTDGERENLNQIIRKLFNLEITSNDGLPTKICRNCVNETKRSFRFYKKVKYSDNLLHDELRKKSNDSAKLRRSDEENVVVKEEEERNFTYLIKFENDYEVDTFESINNLDTSEQDPIIESIIEKSNAIEINENQNYETIKDQGMQYDKETVRINLDLDSKFNKNDPIELYKNGKLIVKAEKLNAIFKQFFDLKCTQCDPSPFFESIEAFFSHYKYEHKTKGFVTCCNKKIMDKKVALYHVRSHVQPLAFQCIICQKGLSTSRTLKYHLKSHLPGFKEKEKSVKCDHCNKKYCSKGSLKFHIDLHHSTNKSVKCKLCDEVFDDKNSLTNHINSSHNDRKYLCPVCGKYFKTKSSLTSHLTTHDDTAKICCKECGLIAKNKYTFRIHLATHFKKKLLKCDKCDYTTTTGNNLRGHQKSKHPDKVYQCSFCKKNYSLKKTLQDHLSQHTGERKYLCKYCPRTFASGGNKYSHMKRMHAEEIQKEVKKKQQMYNSMLEEQLLKESESIKSEEISIIQAKEYLCKLENKKHSVCVATDND